MVSGYPLFMHWLCAPIDALWEHCLKCIRTGAFDNIDECPGIKKHLLTGEQRYRTDTMDSYH